MHSSTLYVILHRGIKKKLMRNTSVGRKNSNVVSPDNMVTNEQLQPMKIRDFLMNIELTND